MVDFVVKDGGNDYIVEVGDSGAAYGGNLSANYLGINLEIGSVSWDGVRFAFEPVPNDLVGLEPWFDAWLDLEGTRYREGEITNEVIHWMMLNEGSIDVDFGTAPIEAFLELLAVFDENGVEHLRISSAKTE